ncbi:hypothetical protein RB619_11955 [Flavobacterium sp. LHD-80]|uniref:hypothetical protein n=1 Tax=Flavobacterium sp. LHD-80 TaxID=3071411 RepID=UPI0027DF2EA4|nr:hypothetical protein [Flavobacterium sp. LHD-80]MDQ6471361.1 hypothetical protein [Flavobacterium sp. LHD-80]
MRKLSNIFEFYKTTLPYNLLFCGIAVFLGGFDYFFIFFLSFGFLASIGYKEFYRKSDYLFYINNGVSKIQLLVFSYLMTFCTAVLFGLIIFLKK